MVKYIFIFTLLFLSSCREESDALFEIKGKSHIVKLEKNPINFPMNELFEFTFNINYDTDITVKVDAQMPSHGHGMNTEAKVEILSSGEFSVKGMKLHMEGDWVLSFDILENGKLKERIEHPFTL